MYAVEFQAPIENGIVHIPKEYQEIQNNTKATFVVMYNSDKVITKQNTINDELDELFANSDNKIYTTPISQDNFFKFLIHLQSVTL